MTLEAQWQKCLDNGYIRNFQRLCGESDAPFEGLHWNDSDVYKWLEAACWALATPDCPPSVREHVELVASLIERAQDEDGYLHTYFQGDKKAERYTWLELSHELYCFGHFIQAAIAHFRATQSTQLLGVAGRLADHLDATFGWEKDGKRETTDGHEEIEMALAELSRCFEGEAARKYLQLARFFIEVRGPDKPEPINRKGSSQAYHQSHAPLKEQRQAVGHAVRAMYLYCGATDLLLEEDDAELGEALDELWRSTTRRRMYVTGGVGSRHRDESFGSDFELPNATAYCETCAGIGLAMWAHRMLLLTGRGEFADVLERALYNNVLAGLSLDGREYFYVNPLESDGGHRRQGWFGCACCPPNIARLMAQLPAYFASMDASSNIWLHLYASSDIQIATGEGEITLKIETRYPWEGAVSVEVRGEGEFALCLRVPAWCEKFVLLINGEEATPQVQVLDGYARIERAWKSGDFVQASLEMPAHRVEAHSGVEANLNRVALMRGPLVYCLEEADHAGEDIFALALADDAPLQATERADVLPIAVVMLRTQAECALSQSNWDGELFRPARVGRGKSVDISAIPYFAWANRAPGKMRVWIPRLAR